MTEELIVYKSIRIHQLLAIVIAVILIPVSFLISDWIFPAYSSNLIILLVIYLGFPFIIALIGVIIGSQAKGRIEYNPPQWDYKPVQIEIEEAAKFESKYLREYIRLTPNGHFWLFYVPLLILLGSITLPIYAAEIDLQIIPYVGFLFAVALASLFLSSVLLGFLASSNDASEDFQVPLFREAVWLARMQSKLPGIKSVRIVIDKADVGNYRVYDNPRTFIRLEELDNSAYIETWTRELRAIESILCKYHVSDVSPQVVWWWVAQDRIFRKYIGDDKEGYYVKFPVKTASQDFGVKDVELLSRNAIAIVYREFLKTSAENSAIVEILRALGATLE